jgi:hypothetical protein
MKVIPLFSIWRPAFVAVVATWFVSHVSFAQDVNSFDRVKTFSGPWAAAFGDLNKDSIPDMVAVEGNSSHDIKIYYGSENEEFTFQYALNGTLEYYEIYLHDFNNDTIPDIIATSGIDGLLFISDGIGNYNLVIDNNGGGAKSTAIADFDADGLSDVLFGGNCYMNNGDGTFTDKGYAQGGNGGASALFINNDEFPDVASGRPGNGTLLFLIGGGDGTFTELTSISGVIADQVITGQLNADTLEDVVATDFIKHKAVVYFNDADHSFSDSLSLPLTTFATILSINDVNLDGKLDLVSSNDNHIQFRTINGDGTFGEEEQFEIGMGALRGYVFEDVIGEDFIDLVAMSGFGQVKIYSDKLQPTSVMVTNQTYSGSPIDSFFAVTPEVDSVAIDFPLGVPTNAGTYAVSLEVIDDEYEGVFSDSVQIAKRVLTVTPLPVEIGEGMSIPEFEIEYQGFVDGEDDAVIATKPIGQTAANTESAAGEYPITVAGGADENYDFEYEEGVLTISVITGLAEWKEVRIFPNPTSDVLLVNTKSPVWYIELVNSRGQGVQMKQLSEEQYDLGNVSPGFYVLRIMFLNNTRSLHKVIVK